VNGPAGAITGPNSGEDRVTRAGMSREGFSRMFFRRRGMPPHAFWLMARLNQARELLRAGEGIARVATAAGRLYRPESPQTVVPARLWRHPGPLPLRVPTVTNLIGAAVISLCFSALRERMPRAA
jgi:hypothetical protein